MIRTSKESWLKILCDLASDPNWAIKQIERLKYHDPELITQMRACSIVYSDGKLLEGMVLVYLVLEEEQLRMEMLDIMREDPEITKVTSKN